MITKQKQLFYFVGDQPFRTLKEAQLRDLGELAATLKHDPTLCDIAEWMLENAAAIVDTLTTTPTSRAKARKTNGAMRTRKRPVLAPATLPEP